MRPGSLLCALVCLAACSSGGIGDHCGDQGDCDGSLQCVQGVCVPHCQRAPDCGDGYSCDKGGICRQATGQTGDSCTSEVQCAAGLACNLNSTVSTTGMLDANCEPAGVGHPAGDTCLVDGDCRNGTCALGHCVDLCADSRDCAEGESCTMIPRVELSGAMFAGCLPARGTITWSIPITKPTNNIVYLPIPDSAVSAAVTFAVDDPNQKVGVVQMTSPSGTLVIDPMKGYFDNLVRHEPELAQSVLAMPTSTMSAPLESGAYLMNVTSLRADGVTPGSATPIVTAVIKVDTGALLDLHFYFLNFDDHPCSAQLGQTLNAQIAQTATFFQTEFLDQLRAVFTHGGVTIGDVTYEDLRTHPELDGLDVKDAPALLALGAHTNGINVFFVRTLSPVGLQAFGPNPGPAALAGTRQSGIIVSLDTLCYRSWATLARLTAHELSRYMGLYDNVEIGGQADPIPDSDMSNSNLMFYSELGGIDLSPGQRDVLSRSTVLR